MRIIQNIFLTCILAFSMVLSASAFEIPSDPKVNEIIVEGRVTSLKFTGLNKAKMAFSPCSLNVECDDIVIKITSSTQWKKLNEPITYRQALQLDWDSAFVVAIYDNENNAIEIKYEAPPE